LKFGVNIINFGPGASPEALQRWAQFTEDTGFHLAMISDHVAITPDVQELFPSPFYDPFISLSLIAAITSKIELGTTVTILPYRHPILTARMAANIDQFCGGRFILGVGAGWAKQEFEALGVPFDQRGAIANEYLEIIRSCWTNEVASYEGKYVSFKNIQTGPRPVENSNPPIWVGGTSDGALRRAVRFGDAWHPYGIRINWLREEGLPRLHQIAEYEGKLAPVLCPRITLRLTVSPLAEHMRKAGQGTLDQIHSDLVALESLGAEYILLDTYAGKPEQTLNPEEDWKMLSLLAEQVLDLENQTLR
jgi:probable F420-dependent oxidoreductase